ncbi:response regulator [Streptococcus suis]|uniref:response regulator n=1 Tax=Streptococcus suis TaxID=1307 RepID=UPI00211D157B|nr:response regulator [Streptococcus suis]UUM55083.1 response regulator [Streptococcus suis]
MQKILLIEDDKTISQLVAKNLINWGYQVQEVKDFQMVLEQMEEFQPHLILLDIGLPFLMWLFWLIVASLTSKETWFSMPSSSSVFVGSSPSSGILSGNFLVLEKSGVVRKWLLGQPVSVCCRKKCNG